MKKILITVVIALFLLSGCAAPPASKDSCSLCGKRPAFLYELDGMERTFCKTCYESEREALEQERINLKNGIN